MVDVARVNMFGHPVGTFRWDERYAVARFEYAPGFVARGLEPSPLLMPVREGRVYSFAGLNRDTFMGLPGMLAEHLREVFYNVVGKVTEVIDLAPVPDFVALNIPIGQWHSVEVLKSDMVIRSVWMELMSRWNL